MAVPHYGNELSGLAHNNLKHAIQTDRSTRDDITWKNVHWKWNIKKHTLRSFDNVPRLNTESCYFGQDLNENPFLAMAIHWVTLGQDYCCWEGRLEDKDLCMTS